MRIKKAGWVKIALILLKALGRTTLGLGYAIAIADGILALLYPFKLRKKRQDTLSNHKLYKGT
ncbi:MAG: anion permease [Helicobacter sp.]|nr:anion permease [Helicobacter sp.]